MGAHTHVRGAVSVIGFGIGGSPRWTRQLLSGLESEGVDALDVFVASARVTVVVSTQDVERAARHAHTSFVKPARDVVEQEG